MKVLTVLVERAGQVVTRNEIFDAVWGNQVVSEDALTRCVSDVRGQLRILTGREDWVETLPKRGYRWIGRARATTGVEEASPAPVSRAPGTGPPAAPGPPIPRRLLGLAGRGAIHLAVLIVMASLVVWSFDRLSGPPESVVAVLPVAADTGLRETASGLDLALSEYIMGLEGIRVLSPSAVESRPVNPFPFFYYEFGGRWLVESELRVVAGHTMLTVTVADARTGIAEMQLTERIAGGDPRSVLAALSRFFEAELAR